MRRDSFPAHQVKQRGPRTAKAGWGVKAPHQQTPPKKGNVTKGKDLRTGK